MVGGTTPKAVPAGRILICRSEFARLKADIPSLAIGSLDRLPDDRLPEVAPGHSHWFSVQRVSIP